MHQSEQNLQKEFKVQPHSVMSADDGPLSASPRRRSDGLLLPVTTLLCWYFFFILNLQHFFLNQRPKHSHFTLCISIVCELFLKYDQKKRWLVQKNVEK